ncbi:MAG: hypothetical protein ACPLXC_01335 [Candidatus Pacearchaeota archaeon]
MKNIEKKLQEKENKRLRNKIYRIIDQEAKKFNIEKDYVWLKLYSSSEYSAVIKISKDKKPLTEERFLLGVAYRLYRELGIKTHYDMITNKGKYQKLHY